jgi:hypothetical protein
MKVHVADDPIRQRKLIYVQVSDDGLVRRFQGPDEVDYDVRQGEEPPLYASVPYFIADAIGEALAPRPAFSERHLEDAIKVRDVVLGAYLPTRPLFQGRAAGS